MDVLLPFVMQERLRCPVCKGQLICESDECICQRVGCGARFPIIDGIPVLINEANSVFRIQDFVTQAPRQQGGWKEAIQPASPA